MMRAAQGAPKRVERMETEGVAPIALAGSTRPAQGVSCMVGSDVAFETFRNVPDAVAAVEE